MPIGALIDFNICWFCLNEKTNSEELNIHPVLHRFGSFSFRFAAPVAIVIIFVAWIIEVFNHKKTTYGF